MFIQYAFFDLLIHCLFTKAKVQVQAVLPSHNEAADAFEAPQGCVFVTEEAQQWAEAKHTQWILRDLVLRCSVKTEILCRTEPFTTGQTSTAVAVLDDFYPGPKVKLGYPTRSFAKDLSVPSGLVQKGF